MFLHEMEPSLSHHHVHVAIVLGSDGKLGDSSMMCTSPVLLDETRRDGKAATPLRPMAKRPAKDKLRVIFISRDQVARKGGKLQERMCLVSTRWESIHSLPVLSALLIHVLSRRGGNSSRPSPRKDSSPMFRTYRKKSCEAEGPNTVRLIRGRVG